MALFVLLLKTNKVKTPSMNGRTFLFCEFVTRDSASTCGIAEPERVQFPLYVCKRKNTTPLQNGSFFYKGVDVLRITLVRRSLVIACFIWSVDWPGTTTHQPSDFGYPFGFRQVRPPRVDINVRFPTRTAKWQTHTVSLRHFLAVLLSGHSQGLPHALQRPTYRLFWKGAERDYLNLLFNLRKRFDV